MRAPVVRRKQRKGIAVVLTTLSMFVMVPIVGLGIDVSTLYSVHGLEQLGAVRADRLQHSELRCRESGRMEDGQRASDIVAVHRPQKALHK